jgi:LEA14-like dessication related protein
MYKMYRRRASRRKVALITVVAVAGAAAFLGYFSIEAAKNMDVSIYDSTVLSKDDLQTKYNAKLQFKNTSFVPLTVGDTTYSIKVDGDHMGTGMIGSFLIGPYSTVIVDSEFTGDNAVLQKYDNDVPPEHAELAGTTSYNLYVTTLDIPISHSPTAEQIQKFTGK